MGDRGVEASPPGFFSAAYQRIIRTACSPRNGHPPHTTTSPHLKGSTLTPIAFTSTALLPLTTEDPNLDQLTGLVGFAARLIDSLGEFGVFVFTLLETVFPPIPSEIILPLAGFLSQQGTMNIWLAIVASTLGAYLGALLLYLLGAAIGLERAIVLLAKLPLVDRQDFDKAADWFHRHGRPAIFFGRLIPGVRSLISLPAGAEHMNLVTFSIFTILGSGLWNTVLIAAGAALGSQYELVDEYSHYLNYAVYAALGGLVLFLVIRQVRRSLAQRHSE